MEEKLRSCPFCSSEDVELIRRMREDGYGDYSHDDMFVMCHYCYAQGPNIYVELFSQRTKYSYRYLERHPEIREKLNEKYDEYIQQKKQEAIAAWNKRFLTRSREEIVAKIDEYLKLPIEKQLEPRNLGFYDALRWVVDKEDKINE